MEINDGEGNVSLRLPPQRGLELLGSTFQLMEKVRESQRLTFYDTWEWNLWFQQLFLFTRRDEIFLAESKQGWPGPVRIIAGAQRPFPRFAREFADLSMRSRLSSITGFRALGKVATLRTALRKCDLLNQHGKIVCRLELTEISAKEIEPFYRFATLHPLRGYNAEAETAMKLLEEGGATPMVDGPLAMLFEQEGRSPHPYTLKPVFNIHPDTPARKALRIIVRRMLEIAVSNENGILQDIDTEFLHDYRICIRKIRSALSLVKGVYPQEQTESLKRTLATLGSATNRLRDLDVYLLARDDYTRLIPEALRPGLETMFRDFAQERKGALKKLRVHLASSGYRSQMEELEQFFAAPDALPVSPTSQDPIGPLVARRIRKRYRMIRKLRRTLTSATPDKVVHQLRIDCKKLRYLLEFFSELFAAEETSRIQKQLRRLQTRLGVFNDYSVQQVALLQYWKQKRKECVPREVSDALSLSLGGLIGTLHHRQKMEREQIHDALDAFCAKNVKGLFKRTFPIDPPPRSHT